MSEAEASWQDGKSLAECNKYMLDNSVSTDVTFIVGEDKKEVRAHKYVLGSRSSVFYAMLYGPMAESTSTITVPDIEPDIFLELVRFMYYEDVSINTSNVTALMLAADKYNITGVVRKCMDYINSETTVDTACSVLECTVLLNKDDLVKKCLEFIFENAVDVLNSESFCHLHRDSLKLILMSDELSVEEELVYESVLKWGECQCNIQNKDVSDTNIRNCIGDLIKFIRFPNMEIEYFSKHVSKGNVLTSDEKVKIFERHFHNESERGDLFCLSKERKRRENICLRGTTFSRGGWHQNGRPDKIDFTVSEKVKITGFVVCAAESTGYDVSAKLFESSTELDAVKLKIKAPPGEKMCHIMFQSGVYVNPGVRYTASIKMVGPDSTVCENTQAMVTKNGITFQFHTSSQPNNGTNICRGQIPGIIFLKKKK